MINNDDIKKILNLSDSELEQKITAVMNATGKNTSGITPDSMSKIKNAVSKMSEKDINTILSNVPKDKLEQIKKIVKTDS